MARPVMVAICGDSGTGKAALSAGIRRIFGEELCSEVALDGYFGLNRVQRNAVGLSPLDPRTHDFAAMDEGLWRLSHGDAVTVPLYDHLMGAVSGSQRVEAREVVLVQGRFPLATHYLRSLFDVRVWLERAPDAELPWTVHRPPVAGGANDGDVQRAIERRRTDYQRHVAPQAAFADIRITIDGKQTTFAEGGLSSSVPTDLPEKAAAAILNAAWDDLALVRRLQRPAEFGVFPSSNGSRKTWAPLALMELRVAHRVAVALERPHDD